ncbi:hypothetical protein GCM10011289_10010 [Paludibacterium paludis]|uniref:Uncharacterized protein n=2 Tax=Paludibacterium paludis TaxID=1225769 RepID=A0A918U8B2_9NEIS|nr:hypothetical protein GCM10011289_10010 [Paludibacterium paludis]
MTPPKTPSSAQDNIPGAALALPSLPAKTSTAPVNNTLSDAQTVQNQLINFSNAADSLLHSYRENGGKRFGSGRVAALYYENQLLIKALALSATRQECVRQNTAETLRHAERIDRAFDSAARKLVEHEKPRGLLANLNRVFTGKKAGQARIEKRLKALHGLFLAGKTHP